MASARLATAKKFLGYMGALDLDGLASVLAPGYLHQWAPSSLEPAKHGPIDKATFIGHLSQMMPLLTELPITTKEITDSESSRRVVVWATATPKFRDEVKDEEEDWDYTGEYIFQITMDESGEKAVHCLEFLDSKTASERQLPLVLKAVANLQKKASAAK